MGKIDPSHLADGDIVIYEWISGFWHTAICTDHTQGLITHCVNEQVGTVQEPAQAHYNDASNVYAFRLTGKNLSISPVQIAGGWRQGGVPYDTARGSGVVQFYTKTDQKQGNLAPPFGYDALYRVFKWASRLERFNKRDHGTTCCAFVMACYQVAAMQSYLEAVFAAWAIYDTALYLQTNRASKSTKITEPKLRAQMTVSNVGSKDKMLKDLSAEDLWSHVKAAVLRCDWDPTTLAEIFTTPLFSDAKFTYSHTFYNKLLADQNWQQVV